MYQIHFDIKNQQDFFDECHPRLLASINRKRRSLEKRGNTSSFLYQFLKKYSDKDNLEALMCASLREQINIIDNWDKLLVGEKDSKEQLYKLFVTNCYERSVLQTDNWKWNLIKNLNLTVCPYCGRSYITSITKENNGYAVKPQLDHYLPKHKYPFLAMTYRNLIPCCNVCNMIGAKGDNDPIDFTLPDSSYSSGYKEFLMNPYEYKEGELDFSFDLKDLNLLSPESYDVIFNAPNYEEGYKKWLALELLYRQHNDLVRDNVVKSFLLYTALPKLYKGSFSIESSQLKLLTQCTIGFEYDHSKDSTRIMSKFHREIFFRIMELIKNGKKVNKRSATR